ATNGPRPTKFSSKAEGVVEFQLERIAADPKDRLEQFARERERARIEALLASMGAEVDKEEVARLQARLQVIKAQSDEEEARAQVAAAEARLEEAKATVAQARFQVELSQTTLARATLQLKLAQDRFAAAQKAAEKPGKNPAAAPA